MKLRWKTLVIVASTLVALVMILGLSARAVLERGFAKVENEAATRDVRRVRDAVAETVNTLVIKASDWAMWDDTWEFVVDHNEEYVQSNLADESLTTLGLSFMLFVDNGGQVVFGRLIDPEEGAGQDIPEPMLDAIVADDLLVRHADPGSRVAGLLLLPDGPVTVTSLPIVQSSGEGPVHGALLFGRRLDDAEVERLGSLTHLSVLLRAVDDAELPEDMAAMVAALAGDTVAVRPLDAERMAGYTLLEDVHRKAVLIARIDTPRDVYRQGQLTILYLLAAILVAGLVFGAVIVVLLQRMVLSRVSLLDAEVKAIAESGDHARRVAPRGRDELAALGTEINRMLAALQESEAAVREGSREMRLVMDTVPSGLLSIDEAGRVGPQHSRSAARILGLEVLADRDFFELLGMTGERDGDRRKLGEFLSVLRKGILDDAGMADLNPFPEYYYEGHPDGRGRWLRLRYFLIGRADSPSPRVLVAMEDVSEEKASVERAAESERENVQLRLIAEDPDLFREFLGEATQVVRHAGERLDALRGGGESRELVNELFRDVHTVKGTASSFGLAEVTEIAGDLEDALSPLRASGEVTAALLDQTSASLERLRDALAGVVERTRSVLGDDGDSGGTSLRIPLEKLKGEAEAVDRTIERELAARTPPEELRRRVMLRLRALGAVPARRGFAKALRIVPGLIERLGKDVRLSFEGGETPIPASVARELNTPLVHLLRNCLDHGIEEPEEREAAGKSATGEVTLAVERSDGSILLRVSDDGRGLDPDRLRAAAAARGLLPAPEAARLTDAEARELIFRPGFTTAERVSQVSGRGVGLDAVLVSVRTVLGGTVSVRSETGKGTTFTLAIPVDSAW